VRIYSILIDIEHYDEAGGHKYHEFPSPLIIASEELTERVDTSQKRLYIQLSNPTQTVRRTVRLGIRDFSGDVTVFSGHLRNAQ